MSADSRRPEPVASRLSPETDEEELLAVAREWAEAIASNSAEHIASFVTDDWVIVSESGVSPGTTFLALVASGELKHSAMTAVGASRVRVFGETAALTSRITSTSHYLGRRSDADEWTTDIFVRRAGRWLCTLTHYTAARPSS
jgi:ketosteroid isomerase-like protein